jgi:hypothetical protein
VVVVTRERVGLRVMEIISGSERGVIGIEGGGERGIGGVCVCWVVGGEGGGGGVLGICGGIDPR